MTISQAIEKLGPPDGMMYNNGIERIPTGYTILEYNGDQTVTRIKILDGKVIDKERIRK